MMKHFVNWLQTCSLVQSLSGVQNSVSNALSVVYTSHIFKNGMLDNIIT